MKRKNKSTAILALVFLVGLSLLLYPTVSDYWNSFRQSRAIASYLDAVNEMDEERYQALIAEARTYNEMLVGNERRFRFDDAQKAEYCSMLGADGDAIGYIEIQSIKVMLPIYLGTTESILQEGVGAMEGASLPVGGESTHAVLTGHRGLPTSKLFTNLDKLAEGNIFYVHVLNETITYEVDQILIVEPTEMDALAIEEGKDYCTLVTCTPYGINSHRMLVRGHRIETPADAVFQNVSADAFQIAPLVVAPLLAVPVVIALLVWLVIGGEGSESKRKKMMKSLQAKKKGGDEHEKMDR